ncbi:MAG TPA: sialate O-acetylesterase, partial [Verrucomicrobiales bacterium]|nr:sialate O-acetylesterase [Verrucomicrobiales bacterium]
MVDCPFRRVLILVCGLATLPCTPGKAALTVAAVFGDNAVLQREAELPVWGSAPAGTEVHVEFAGQSRIATADADGKWIAQLEAMPASSEGRPLQIRSSQDRITFKNVVVGEVWLASGQSNMQFPMSACARRIKTIAATLREQPNPNIRFLRISCPDSP